MIKTLRESQLSNRAWIPYGRLISEILHQGGILKALSDTQVFTDKHLGTVTGKVINGSTLRHMKLIRKEDYKKLNTDLKESIAISNLMEGFPLICKQDPLDVQLYFIHDHLQTTRKTIQLEAIPKQMYGGALPVAKGRKTKKRALTKAEYLDEASVEPPKKSKKAKVAEATGSALSTIQEQVQDLEPLKVLNKRTRSGKEAEPSPSQPAQPSIPRRKRKPVVRKLNPAPEEEEVEEASELVTREVRRRKEIDTAIEKALQLAKEIEISAEVLAKESTVEAAQLGLELTENLQQMIVADGVLKTIEDAPKEAGCSEVVASEAPEGNIDSHIAAEIVTIEYSTSPDTRSNSTSSSSSTSSDMDDVPLNKVYTTLNKALSPSPSTKTQKKPNYDTFVPMYPSVEQRLIDMQQRRIYACKNLLADHPLQPPMIDPIQFVPANAEGVDDHTGTDIANIDVSSSQPISQTQTSTQTYDPSIIQNLVNHHSGEVPEYETNQDKASDIASNEVMTESPQ